MNVSSPTPVLVHSEKKNRRVCKSDARERPKMNTSPYEAENQTFNLVFRTWGNDGGRSELMNYFRS